MIHHPGSVSFLCKAKVNGTLYCCTVHFEDSLSITYQQMH
jgi:hypothetical protein